MQGTSKLTYKLFICIYYCWHTNNSALYIPLLPFIQVHCSEQAPASSPGGSVCVRERWWWGGGGGGGGGGRRARYTLFEYAHNPPEKWGSGYDMCICTVDY